MTAKVDQKSYLQKYLGGPSVDKKKKKKKVVKGKGFKIIDDDLDLTKLRALEGDELDVFDEGEDAPQIAGIIDDRPEELKKLDQTNTTSKWKVINQDDGFNSKLQIQEIKKDIKEVEKENELVFGKMYSDSEEEQKHDSDPSPPRKSQKETTKSDTKSKTKPNSDSDASPPRKDKRRDDNASLPRKQQNTAKKRQNNSDSDVSPPRRGRYSPKRKSVKRNSDSNLSPPRNSNIQRKERKSRKPSRWGDVDEKYIEDSSPKKSKKRRSQSPKKNRSSSSDLSPPRKSQRVDKNYDSDLSPPRKDRKPSPKKRNRPVDADTSPPRKRYKSPERHQSDKYKNNDKRNDRDKYNNRHKNDDLYKRRDSSSDLSPPRHKRLKSESPSRNKFKKNFSENRNKRQHSVSPNRKEDRNSEKDRYKRSSDSPPPTNKKMAKTLEGKMAGLQNAVQLRQENDAFRKREEEAFKRLTDDMSGRNAQAVSRKSKRESSQERQKLKEKAERQKELDEKYKKWSKGVKQMEAQEARVQEFMLEASKPLARHKDDRDLEDRLKQIERDGDPMLRYIREKKRERGDLGPEKPTYKGNFPPNRFNIRPGYRWDGVDRSNGYEKKYFEQQSKRRAQEEEAYKWSTEDL